MPELSKSYEPSEHEGRIWDRWESASAFAADPMRVLSGAAEPYCVLMPPPNVTGALHLGHALNGTIQDVLIRAHRLKGFEAAWLPGTDHAGIATQSVVDKRLAEAGEPALADYKKLEDASEGGRDKFIAKVQAWKDEYEARITDQFKRLGASADWDRLRFTMDPICAAAVREGFFRLFKDGLIYRGKRLVNWDPVTQTALADDEVESRDVDGHFYYLRYPLVHKTEPGDHRPVTWGELAAKSYPGAGEHPEDDEAWITIATTRPETFLGDVCVAVNPADPRAAAVRGMLVELPMVGRVLPIIEDEYVVLPVRYGGPEGDPKAEFATGFLKVTPAHDTNDYELGLKHRERIEADCSAGEVFINVMAPDGSISDAHGWRDVGDAHLFVGLSREAARQKVVEEFQAHTLGDRQPLLEEIKPYRHSVGHSYRSHAAVEYYLSDQWYCKVTDDRLRGSAQRALQSEQRTDASLEAWPESKPAGGMGFQPVPSSPTSRSIPDHLTIHRRHLPHWQLGGSTYFVTFRTQQRELSAVERDMVLDACFYFHDERMLTRLVTVMPDHVHMLVTPLRQENGWWPLESLVHSIKSFTANEINRSRGTDGPLWQQEYYDRIVRDEGEFREKWNYMLQNPVRAGLAAAVAEYPHVRRGDEMTGAAQGDGLEAHPTGDSAASGEGSMTFHPARYARNYEGWHDNLRDWCISRQLWWGHRIPVWSETASRDSAANDAFEDRLSRLLIDGEVAIKSEEFDDSTLRRTVCVRGEHPGIEADLEANGFARDPDVLDTWFSSALWPVSTMGWPADDLPPVAGHQIDPAKAGEVRQVWVKRVGSFSSFIGTEGEHSGTLIDTLLHLRDKARSAAGTQPIAYQLFSEAEVKDKGQSANPRVTPDQIQEISDMVCAVAVKTDAPVATEKFGTVRLDEFLLAHGFRPTAGMLEAFNPTSVLCTAREIITLWVSRMVMFNRYFLGGAGPSSPVPFKDVFIHAMIQDGEGRKMSKSLGNGVDPLDIIASHGADALRFTLVEMTTQTQDVRMPVEADPATGKNTSPKFDLGRNFCNKLWNAARFAMSKLPEGGAAADAGAIESIPMNRLTLPDRWMLGRLRAGIAEIDRALAEYQFSSYAKALYDLVRRDFCDWYLEAIKPTVAESPEQQAVLRNVLDALLRVLHPVMPYITEAIYEALRPLRTPAVDGLTLLPPRKGGVLCTARWPEVDAALADTDAAERFARVQGLVDAVRAVRSQQGVDPKRRVTLHASAELAAFVESAGGVVESLAGLASVVTDPAQGASSAFVFEGGEHRLSDLADAVDPAAERARLEKELQGLGGKRAGLEKRLSNPGYTEKAPAHLVQQTRDELDAVIGQIETIEDAIRGLAQA